MKIHPIQKKLQWLLISRLMISVVLLVVVGVIEQGNISRPFAPILFSVASAVLLLSLLYYFALKSRVPQLFQCYAQLSVDLGIVTWLVYSTGDVESPFIALYLVIIFAASTLFNRRGVLAIGFSSGILYLTIGLCILLGLFHRASGWPAHSEITIKWIEFLFSLNLIAVFFVTVLSGHLA